MMESTACVADAGVSPVSVGSIVAGSVTELVAAGSRTKTAAAAGAVKMRIVVAAVVAWEYALPSCLLMTMECAVEWKRPGTAVVAQCLADRKGTAEWASDRPNDQAAMGFGARNA